MDRPVLYRRPVQRKADRRRAKARRPYRLASERLWAWTAERLRRGWSPLPICGRLRLEHPGDETMRCCPETLYRWVYADRTRRERWARCLPRGHRRRRRARGRGVARIRIPGRTPIRERPYEPSDRSRCGEWEADSVIGAGCNLHTEVERRTRFLMARIVPDKTADASVAAQIAMFSALPAGARTGVTHDNGTEFARHGRLRERLGMATYFADPYSLCQRGGSENRNGAIRRHLPKTHAHRPVHGRRRAGHRGRDRQPSHAGTRLPHAGRGVHRRTARINQRTRALHF